MNASPAVKRECVHWDLFSESLMDRAYNLSDLIGIENWKQSWE